MGKKMSDELRRALDDPAVRYRIVDTWVLLQRKEELEARKAAIVASRNRKADSFPPPDFAFAVASRGLDVTPGRRYKIVPDPKAKEFGLIRIIDDSGEDYLYPEKYFSLDLREAE